MGIRPLARKIFFAALLSLCFLLPFEPEFLVPVELLMILSFLLAYPLRDVWKRLLSARAFLVFPAFFLFTLFSGLSSDNSGEAGRQIMVKLPFLLVPVLLAGNNLQSAAYKQLLYAFAAGCLLSGFVQLGWSSWEYMQTGERNVFFHTRFARFMHITYLGMYQLFAAGFLTYDAFEDQGRRRTLKLLAALCCLLFVLLASAKIMFLALLLSSLLFAWYIFRFKNNSRFALLFLSAGLLLPTLIMLLSPALRIRFLEGYKEFRRFGLYSPDHTVQSTGQRVLLWTNTFRIIQQHPFTGTGVGDVQNEIDRQLLISGDARFMPKKLNAHNEYLQTWAGLGIGGLLLWLLILALPLWQIPFPQKFPALLFSFSAGIASLTESILERQAGTLFICLFACVLINMYQTNLNTSPR